MSSQNVLLRMMALIRHKKTAAGAVDCDFTSVDDQVGALREIRTPDPLVRSQVLYPAEL